VNGALVPDDLAQSRLDDAGSDELRADAKCGSSSHSNDHFFLGHVQQLDAARVVLEERVENAIDDLLHRFTHPRSMRNCRPKRKQS
jgi:hypothetical protein